MLEQMWVQWMWRGSQVGEPRQIGCVALLCCLDRKCYSSMLRPV